tara:strand:- start:7015 stop:9327 length:2313 start_codon:yes stop_codon:yes gene_type:complete
MATVDKLIVRIEADMKDLKAGLAQTQRASKNATANIRQSFSKLRGTLGGVAGSIFSLKGAIVGLGVGAGLKSLIGVGNEVESLQIRFETLFGSAEEGAKAFDTMATFAGKVPFSLQQIQAGSGSLLAVADDADELGELLQMTGTIAAATGLDFRTASEQIQRSLSAGIGAADLFRDRGVTAMLGFKAGTKVSVRETREALEKFAKENDGITDRLAGTFSGTLSMIGDAVFTFQRTLNDAGFFRNLTNHFKDLQRTINENQAGIKEFAQQLSEVLSKAMTGLRNAIVFVVKNFDDLVKVIGTFIALKLASVVINIGSAFYGLATALGIAGTAQKNFNIAVLKNPYVIAAVGVAKGVLLVKDGFGKLAETLGLVSKETEELNQFEQALNKSRADSIEFLKKQAQEQEIQKKIKQAQIEASKELEEAIEEERFAIKLLEAETRGATEADLELMKVRREFKDDNPELLSQLISEIQLRQAHQNAIKAEKEAMETRDRQVEEALEKEKEKQKLLEKAREDALRVQQKQRDEEKALMEELGFSAIDLSDKIETLNRLKASGKISSAQFAEGLGELNLKMFESTKAGAILMQGLDRTMTSLSDTMADSLMGMGEGWKGFRDSLKNIARDIIAQFIKIQIQAALARAVGGMSGGAGFLGSVAGFFGGGGGSSPTVTSSYTPSAFAGGGYVAPNQAHIVGERGPELFVPNTAGNIMTNNRSRQMSGGGGTVNQTLNFDVGVAQTVRAEIVSLLPTIKQQSVDAMIDAKERGGRVADIFK